MEETRKPARKPRAAAAPKPAAKKAVPAGRTPAHKSAAKTASKTASVPTVPSPTGREEMIRMAAYYRAERRGFVPGAEWDDWLAAEAEVRAVLDGTPVPQARKPSARRPGSG